MSKGKIRHMFPGGNTPRGFHSFYNYIMPQEEARRIFVLKGGPGVGKSTFMKKTALEFADLGYDVEFMHCSSDNNSLDGIVIPRLGIAMLDGTAPHVVDPKNPGAVDEIINLGEFWNEDEMRLNREAILKITKKISSLFARAYRYINAAASVYEDTAVIYGWAMNTAGINSEASEIIESIFAEEEPAEKEGSERKLFASALTPNGLQNYLDTIMVGEIIAVKGEIGTGTEKLLEKIKAAALEKGYYVEAYYCPMNPEKLEHLVIPAKNVSFATVNRYHGANLSYDSEINLNEYLDVKILDEYKDVLEYNNKIFEELLHKGLETISRAKALHDELEKYYIPNMDFEAVQRCWESVVARITDYAKEK